jgi:hypothetical protein
MVQPRSIALRNYSDMTDRKESITWIVGVVAKSLQL